MDLMDKKSKRKPKETGRWTKEEHSRFILGLMTFGKNWKKVEELVATRTGAQVRSHAQKFFNRLTKVKQTFAEHLEEGGEFPQQHKKTEEITVVNPLFHIPDEEPPKVIQEGEKKQSEDSEDEFSDPYGSKEEEVETMGPPPFPQPQIIPKLTELIRQQSKDGQKPIHYKTFLEVLNKEKYDLEQSIEKKRSTSSSNPEAQKAELESQLVQMELQRLQIKNLANVLVAYIALQGDTVQTQDESFFLKILKRHRNYITKNRFLDMVDLPTMTLHKEQSNNETSPRKKSFQLVDHSEEVRKDLDNLQKMVKYDTEEEAATNPRHDLNQAPESKRVLVQTSTPAN